MKEDEHTYLQKKGRITAKSAWLCLCILMTLLGKTTGLAQNATKTSMPTVFDDYFAKAQQFAVDYPREKVYLHFDNNSYYQGDTIWFKAYVVSAAYHTLSNISKPLYVDFVDELGNTMDRQIIQLNHGEGNGYISLSQTFFTGYYEVRAYTKWMLAFDNPTYFSRVLPVYRKRLNNDEAPRQLGKYNMSDLMKERPKEKIKKLDVRFYPEGGRLIRGVPSLVGIEALSADSGWVNISGSLVYSKEGREVTEPISTIHDGMGSFMYTPEVQSAKATFFFRGKEYTYELPPVESVGYAIHVRQENGAFEVTVSRNEVTPPDSLALFLFSEGVPLAYYPLKLNGSAVQTQKIPVSILPDGIIHFSLMNARGVTFCDRFSFVEPRELPTLEGCTDSKLYHPFAKATMKVKLTDESGRPIPKASLSVAVRDGKELDYVRDNNSILTDLLLTSDLKGYISHPAFFFIDQSPVRLQMLDNLLLIHGWRQYDVAQLIGQKAFMPKYELEQKLTLLGQVTSNFGKEQNEIGIAIDAKKLMPEGTPEKKRPELQGGMKTNEHGYFAFKFDDNFFGDWETVLFTHMEGKKIGKNTKVLLFRNFEPELRPLAIGETHPRWDDIADTMQVKLQIDSFNTGIDKGVRQLQEVVVKSKNRQKAILQATEWFERDILAYYNVHKYVQEQLDEGKCVAMDVAGLLHDINSSFLLCQFEDETTGRSLMWNTYNGMDVKYCADGRDAPEALLHGAVNRMKTALIYMDRTGYNSYKMDKNYRMSSNQMLELYTQFVAKGEALGIADASSVVHVKSDDQKDQSKAHVDTWNKPHKVNVRCDFTMDPRWRSSLGRDQEHGIRYIDVQGYEAPAKCYSPVYPDNMDHEFVYDNRRTLYWNPDLKTDTNGEATIECYNAHNATFLDVSAETLVGGKPTAVEFTSLTASGQ